MLEALSIVRRTYPDAKLYLAGSSNYSEKETCIRQMRTRYENYIFDLINAYSLQDAVVFCGTLNEQEMCNQYLKAHVFVSPSTIENSPNSLGEAMILGMPSISSDVGGVNSLMQHNVEGYIYQVDAPYMLAYYISRIFQDDGLAMMLCKNAKKRASETHNGEKNAKRLIEIYTSIKSRIK